MYQKTDVSAKIITDLMYSWHYISSAPEISLYQWFILMIKVRKAERNYCKQWKKMKSQETVI